MTRRDPRGERDFHSASGVQEQGRQVGSDGAQRLVRILALLYVALIAGALIVWSLSIAGGPETRSTGLTLSSSEFEWGAALVSILSVAVVGLALSLAAAWNFWRRGNHLSALFVLLGGPLSGGLLTLVWLGLRLKSGKEAEPGG